MRSPVAAAAVVALALGGGACRDECAPELDGGRRYQIKIGAVYEESAAFRFDPALVDRRLPSCSGFDGLSPGAAVVVKTRGKREIAGCDAHTAEVTAGPAELRIIREEAVRGSEAHGFLVAAHRVRLDGCDGLWEMGVRGHASGSVFRGPEPHQLPVLLERRYVSVRGSCEPCGDTFVVTLSPAPDEAPE